MPNRNHILFKIGIKKNALPGQFSPNTAVCFFDSKLLIRGFWGFFSDESFILTLS